jgi:hypothetical protein
VQCFKGSGNNNQRSISVPFLHECNKLNGLVYVDGKKQLDLQRPATKPGQLPHYFYPRNGSIFS